MNRARRSKFNALDAPSLARWIVLTAFLALTGLIYVYLTVQLYHLGDRRKALETELSTARAQNEVARGQIEALTSRSALQRRLKEGYLRMIPIAEHHIVRLNVLPAAAENRHTLPIVPQEMRHTLQSVTQAREDALQSVVVNQRAGR